MIYICVYMACMPLQLAPPAVQGLTLVAPEQDVTVRVWVNRNVVERVELRRPVEHVLIYLAVKATKTAVQLPVWEIPRVGKADGVGPDFLQQVHNSTRAGQLNLADGDGGTGEELAGLGLQSMECEEAVQLRKHIQLGPAELRAGFAGRQGCVERLDDHVLTVGLRQAVEVNEKVVPGLLLLVTALECLESKEGSAPGEGINNLAVITENIKGRTHILLLHEVGQDTGGIVGGLVTFEHRACGFEQLSQVST